MAITNILWGQLHEHYEANWTSQQATGPAPVTIKVDNFLNQVETFVATSVGSILIEELAHWDEADLPPTGNFDEILIRFSLTTKILQQFTLNWH